MHAVIVAPSQIGGLQQAAAIGAELGQKEVAAIAITQNRSKIRSPLKLRGNHPGRSWKVGRAGAAQYEQIPLLVHH